MMRILTGRAYRRETARNGNVPRDDAVERRVRQILDDVRGRGDEAVRAWTLELDGVKRKGFRVPRARLAAAWRGLAPELRRALSLSRERLERGQRALMPRPVVARTGPGVTIRTEWVPLRRVGAYAPGGRAAYPSTVIMTTVPARVAGVDEVVLASPPRRETGDPATLALAAAYASGVDAVYAMGGAQALGALASGTQTMPRFDKIVGPGNAFVMEAKRQLFGTVGIDALAGPSELACFIDDTCDPSLAALDAAAQAEHDPKARIVLFTARSRTAMRLADSLEALARAGPRTNILASSLRERATIVKVKDQNEATKLLDLAGPEHVQVPSRTMASKLRAAGTIFEGRYARASLGDYVTGANHVIPTGGTARWSSPLSVYDFLRQRVRQRVDRAALKGIVPAAVALARAEGLPGHARSIEAGARA